MHEGDELSDVLLEACPRPAAKARGRLLDREAVIVLPDRGEVKVLNEVGARIWALADGSRSVREIAAAIAGNYDVSPAQAEADTVMFLQELREKALIEF
jgi:hypothetical protein